MTVKVMGLAGSETTPLALFNSEHVHKFKNSILIYHRDIVRPEQVIKRLGDQ
jgi:hypothetical protein